MRTTIHLAIAVLLLLSGLRASPVVSAQGPASVDYISFQGQRYTLYAYTGRSVALLAPRGDLDAATMTAIVAALDRAYDYYAQSTGRAPQPYRLYNGLLSIAVVAQTCGDGCGYLGATGIELTDSAFTRLFAGVRDRDEYDQALFYELGRNFWFYEQQIEYRGADATGTIATGYAVFMRFASMEAAGVTIGPFNRWTGAEFRAEVVAQFGRYTANPRVNWENTLRVGQPIPDSGGLGSTDLFASFIFELRGRYGNAFVGRLWTECGRRPTSATTQDAVDNFVIAASVAAGINLADTFASWHWPVSAAARVELAQLFPAATSTHTATATAMATATSTSTPTSTATATATVTSTPTTTRREIYLAPVMR